MQRLLQLTQIGKVSSSLEEKVMDYLREESLHAFESLPAFTLITLDCKGGPGSLADGGRLFVYLDREDFFVFAEGQEAFQEAEGLFAEKEGNDLALLDFFSRLLRKTLDALNDVEERISSEEDAILLEKGDHHLEHIVHFRRELLALKAYCGQLIHIFDDLTDNDNLLLSEEGLARLARLEKRADRVFGTVLHLQDRVSQMREAYQSQIDLEQNQIMKIFTAVTAIFLPLTLLAGWYGMNFAMPEYRWALGYPAVIILSLAISAGLFWVFKRRGWF